MFSSCSAFYLPATLSPEIVYSRDFITRLDASTSTELGAWGKVLAEHMHGHGVWSETEKVLLRAYGCGNYEKLRCRVDSSTGDAKVHRRHSRRVQARQPFWDLWVNKVESAIPTCLSRLSSHIYRLLVCIMQSSLHQVHHLVIFKIFRFSSCARRRLFDILRINEHRPTSCCYIRSRLPFV